MSLHTLILVVILLLPAYHFFCAIDEAFTGPKPPHEGLEGDDLTVKPEKEQ